MLDEAWEKEKSAHKNWPKKTGELQNFLCDSTIWNKFNFRADDIVIATYPKSGTTWMQQIVSQILFDGQEGLDVAAMSPRLDSRISSTEDALANYESQNHRRFIKTHLPVYALPISPQAKYIYVARDGRDVLWSLHNYHSLANDAFYEQVNNTPGRVGSAIAPPTTDIQEYFQQWLENDGHPFWPYWEHVRGFWDIQNLPNVKLVHYNNLKDDLIGQIAEIAQFIGKPLPSATLSTIAEHCSFEYMKNNAEKIIPLHGSLWDPDGNAFINKGTNGRWQNVLSAEDVAAYESMALQKLGQECANWLKTGSRNAAYELEPTTPNTPLIR